MAGPTLGSGLFSVEVAVIQSILGLSCIHTCLAGWDLQLSASACSFWKFLAGFSFSGMNLSLLDYVHFPVPCKRGKQHLMAQAAAQRLHGQENRGSNAV